MNKAQFYYRIGLFLIFSALFIFVFLFVLKFIGAISQDELLAILKFLVPIKTLYISALIKYVIAHQKRKDFNAPKNRVVLSSLYLKVSTIIIYCHFALVILLILLFAVNKIENKEVLLNYLSVIETLFGVHAGTLITDMYTVEEKTTKS